MKLKKTAAKATLAGALGAAAVGLGAGLAQADPPFPVPPPWPVPAPADPGVSIEGPGANIGGPGNLAPPGLNFMPPPGHGGPIPHSDVPDWAPPQPLPPPWAPWLPVQWNAQAQAWGVYTNVGFQPV